MRINSGGPLALMIVLAFALSLIGGMVQGAGIGKNPLLVALGSLISGAAPAVGLLALVYALWSFL
jgi:hypothetical protein